MKASTCLLILFCVVLMIVVIWAAESESATASSTKTRTRSRTATRTRSPASKSRTSTKTKSKSRTPSRTKTKAITKSKSISKAITKSRSLSRSKSRSISQTATRTRTASLSKQAASPSNSISLSRTRTASRTRTPSQSKTISFSPQRSLTGTPSSSKTKVVQVTPSKTTSKTRTRTPSKTPSISLAPSRSCPSGFYHPTTVSGPDASSQSFFQQAYGLWKTRYLVSADPAPGLKVIDPTDCSNPDRSLAQGIAYGMILSAYAGDKASFDSLLEYFEYYRTTEGCLPSVVLDGGVIPPWGVDCDTASAQDIAFALFVAAETWDSDTYFETATKIVTHLYETSVDSATKLVLPFPSPAGTNAGDILIPSYFSPAYYKLFEERDPNSAHDWEGVRNATQTLTTLIQTKQTTRLLPDFANKKGDPVSLTLAFNYRRALSGTYTLGQQSTNSVAAPASNRVALWPLRIQFDPTSNPSKLVFKITSVNLTSSVTLGGNPVAVWVKCGSTYGQATLTSIQQLTNVWVYTPSGQCTFPNGDGIDLIQPVDIRVYTDKSNFYDFLNIESANTQCKFNRDQYDNLYSYEAVRAWFYLALDAAFYGNYPNANPSVSICNTLTSTVFSTTAALDGEKYLDSNPVYNGDFGFEFIAPASLCWITSNATGRQAVFNYLRRDGNNNLLNDKQYLADTLHTLAFLFVGDEFRVPTCKAFGSERSLPGGFDATFEPSLGYTTDAPAFDEGSAFCLRPSTDVNVEFVSAWSVAVEFQDPNVQYYDVSIECSGAGFALAKAPVPDILNTRYITSTCPASFVTIRLTPKAGYTGTVYELYGDLAPGSSDFCATAPPRLQFCWKYQRSQYYLPITTGYTLTSLEAYCFSPDGRFSMDPANGGAYPYMFDKAPSSPCSLTGEVALVVNGNSVVSTNFYNEDQCPFYCFVWNSGTVENGYKITATFQDQVTAVSMDCLNGAGYQVASFEYNYAYSIPVDGCAVNGSIRLKYTHAGSAKTVETNYITSACYSAEALPPGAPPPPSAPTPPPNTLGWLPFCLSPSSSKSYIDIRTFVNKPAMVSGVKVYCAEGWHNATLTQNPQVPEMFSGTITTCPTTAIVVELTYNSASNYMTTNYPDAPTLFNADITEDLCPKICYQSPGDTYYLGVGFSYVATNATISCDGKYEVPLTMNGGYFAGTDDLQLSATGDLYEAITETFSACTTITAYFDKDRDANLPTSGYATIEGQWYTGTSPFTPIPPSNPNLCKK